eukprot:403351205
MAKESDSEYEFRYLQRDDFDKGYLDQLSLLTVVGNVTKEDFEKRFDEMYPSRQDVYKIVVIVERASNWIVGCGTIFFEKKFVRKLSIAGHLEDVNIDVSLKGKGLGMKLIKVLKEIGMLQNCYKIILDCADHNISFYELNGFKLKERCMCWYRNESRL